MILCALQLTDAATITSVALLPSQSWIGQTIALTCVADGVPTQILTWKKPDGTELNTVTALENKKDVTMGIDEDFGNYTCSSRNSVGAADTSTVQVHQISK